MADEFKAMVIPADVMGDEFKKNSALEFVGEQVASMLEAASSHVEGYFSCQLWMTRQADGASTVEVSIYTPDTGHFRGTPDDALRRITEISMSAERHAQVRAEGLRLQAAEKRRLAAGAQKKAEDLEAEAAALERGAQALSAEAQAAEDEVAGL